MTSVKTASFMCLFALGLASCGPVPVYHKDNTSFAAFDQDLLSCQVQALRDAPVANEVRQEPPVYYPGRRICHDGSCYRTHGYWRSGRVYTVDTNEALRNRLERSCMAQKDYALVEVQRCPPGTVRPPKDALRRLLPPTADNCAISLKGGPRVLRPKPD